MSHIGPRVRLDTHPNSERGRKTVTRATHVWRRLAVIVTVALMLIPASLALAAPPDGKGGGKGGGETTLTNNLSVPAIFVTSPGTFNVTCPGGPTDPTGTPLTGYEVDGYFYVQGLNQWQAECTTAAADEVTASVDWGDNLEGTALKSGTPIRVEVGLMDETVNDMVGYHVIKLQPSLSDRFSAYGTEATSETGGVTQITFPYEYATVNGETGEAEIVTDYVRVYDIDARFSLYNTTTGEYVVEPNTLMSAEINATGKIVYGFNWGIGGHGVKSLPTAGDYILTFHAPNVMLVGASDGHTVTLEFTVAQKNNGGGKNK